MGNSTTQIADFSSFNVPDTIYVIKPKVSVCERKGDGSMDNLERWLASNSLPPNSSFDQEAERRLMLSYYHTLQMYLGPRTRVRVKSISREDEEYALTWLSQSEDVLRKQKFTQMSINDTMVEILKKYNMNQVVYANLKEIYRGDSQLSNVVTRFVWYRLFVIDAVNKRLIWYNNSYGGSAVSADDLASRNIYKEKEENRVIEQALQVYRKQLKKGN